MARPLGSEFYQRKQPGEPKDPSAYGQPVPGEIPGGSTETCSPVVQRQRRLVHIQETMVRFHPGLLLMETIRPDTPSRRAARLRPGCLQVRLLFWVLAENYVLVEQLGVLATLSRWRPSVQIRSGTLSTHGMVRQLAERRISNVRGCGFDSLPCYFNNMRRLGIGEPQWL